MRDVLGVRVGQGAAASAGHLIRWAPGRDGALPQSYAPFRRIDPAVLAVAFGLLRLGPQDRFVDLGCGDGAVVEAAAVWAGLAVGVEVDPGLARRACDRLHAAQAAGRVRGAWRVLNEPIGWTSPAGMTAGLANLLPFAGSSLGGWLRSKAPAGFRLVVVGGWVAGTGFGRRAAVVDAVDAGGSPQPVELWKKEAA